MPMQLDAPTFAGNLIEARALTLFAIKDSMIAPLSTMVELGFARAELRPKILVLCQDMRSEAALLRKDLDTMGYLTVHQGGMLSVAVATTATLNKRQ